MLHEKFTFLFSDEMRKYVSDSWRNSSPNFPAHDTNNILKNPNLKPEEKERLAQ